MIKHFLLKKIENNSMIHADIQVTCSIGSDSKLGLNLTFDSFTISMVILLHACLLKAYSVPWNCNIYPKYIDGIEVVGVFYFAQSC